MIKSKVWFYCWPDKKIGYGLIVNEFVNDNIKCFDVIDEINGGFRITKENMLIEKPNNRMMNMLTRSKIEKKSK
tara:strand:- start:816 stop:1037 length:222 start_codon:yes stop_codon:yes gene_type:complete